MSQAFTIVNTAEYRLVAVHGDIDEMSIGDFRRACATERPVVVDLLRCSYIDSSGLSALISRNRGGKLALVLTPDCGIYRIFEITRLLQYFQIAATTRDAAPLVAAPATEPPIED